MNASAAEGEGGDAVAPTHSSEGNNGENSASAPGAQRTFRSRRAAVEAPVAPTPRAPAGNAPAADASRPARAPRLQRMPDGSFASASGSSEGGGSGAGARSYASRGGPPPRPGGGPPPRGGPAKDAAGQGKDGKRRNKDRQDDNVLFGKDAAEARRSARASRKARMQGSLNAGPHGVVWWARFLPPPSREQKGRRAAAPTRQPAMRTRAFGPRDLEPDRL